MTKVAIGLHTWIAARVHEPKHAYAGTFLCMQLANKGCSIATDHRRSLSPFCASAGCLYQVQISLFPKMVTPLAPTEDPLLQSVFPLLFS